MTHALLDCSRCSGPETHPVDGVCDSCLAELVDRLAPEAGLPLSFEDPAALDRLAALVVAVKR